MKATNESVFIKQTYFKDKMYNRAKEDITKYFQKWMHDITSLYPDRDTVKAAIQALGKGRDSVSN